jgi:hypothetical protein
VAALVELHPEDPIARLEDAEIGGHVRLGARVGLDVDVLGAGEQLEGTPLRERLGDVDVLAATVVALARQSLGVLVREPAALGLHDGGRGVVLARDQLDLVVLAAPLALHRGPQLGVDRGDRGVRWAVAIGDRHRSLPPRAGRAGIGVIGAYLPTSGLRPVLSPRAQAVAQATLTTRIEPTPPWTSMSARFVAVAYSGDA